MSIREVKSALSYIEKTLESYGESEKSIDAAKRKLVMIVPLKRGKGPDKKELLAALSRSRGEPKSELREYMKDSRAAMYVRGEDLVNGPGYLFEGDLALKLGGKFGGSEHLGEIIYHRVGDLMVKDAMALDENMEEVDPMRRAEEIVQEATGGGGRRNYTHGRRRNMAGRAASADTDAVRDLVMFVENDGDLYRQQWQPIIKNLANKKAQGKYDHDKAIRLLMYLMESGAKKYAKEFGGTWNVMFSVPTRREAAREFVKAFEDEYRTGVYDKYLTKVSAKAKAANPNRAGARRRARRG